MKLTTWMCAGALATCLTACGVGEVPPAPSDAVSDGIKLDAAAAAQPEPPAAVTTPAKPRPVTAHHVLANAK